MSRGVPAWARGALGWGAAALWAWTLLAVVAPAGAGCPMPLADALAGNACGRSAARVGWAAVWLVLALATSFGHVVALLRRDER